MKWVMFGDNHKYRCVWLTVQKGTLALHSDILYCIRYNNRLHRFTEVA